MDTPLESAPEEAAEPNFTSYVPRTRLVNRSLQLVQRELTKSQTLRDTIDQTILETIGDIQAARANGDDVEPVYSRFAKLAKLRIEHGSHVLSALSLRARLNQEDKPEARSDASRTIVYAPVLGNSAGSVTMAESERSKRK